MVTICLADAGLDYDWDIYLPVNTEFNGIHAANYYRPDDHNKKLTWLADNHPIWLPGDIIVYWWNPDHYPTNEASHVLLYVGDFHYQGQQYDVVEASINFGSLSQIQGTYNNPRRLSDCWIGSDYDRNATAFFHMRLVELETMYRAAGIDV